MYSLPATWWSWRKTRKNIKWNQHFPAFSTACSWVQVHIQCEGILHEEIQKTTEKSGGLKVSQNRTTEKPWLELEEVEERIMVSTLCWKTFKNTYARAWFLSHQTHQTEAASGPGSCTRSFVVFWILTGQSQLRRLYTFQKCMTKQPKRTNQELLQTKVTFGHPFAHQVSKTTRVIRVLAVPAL